MVRFDIYINYIYIYIYLFFIDSILYIGTVYEWREWRPTNTHEKGILVGTPVFQQCGREGGDARLPATRSRPVLLRSF